MVSALQIGQVVDVEVAVRNRIYYEACEAYYYYYDERLCDSFETTYVGAYEQGNGNRTFMAAGSTLQLVFACDSGACATIWDFFEFVEWIPDAAKGNGSFFTAGRSPGFQLLNKCDEAKVNATRGCGYITLGRDVRLRTARPPAAAVRKPMPSLPALAGGRGGQ